VGDVSSQPRAMWPETPKRPRRCAQPNDLIRSDHDRRTIPRLKMRQRRISSL
ncbi:unnamed protein product, partial [Acidocella sp. C78]